MKTKRVGLFSMGISLIAFGVIILLSQFNLINGAEISIKLFPVILIVLGIEIIYCNHKNEVAVDKSKIQVDFFSVFYITILLFTNVVLYSMLELGLNRHLYM